jgi:glucose-6-phosphate-specific signal transduction histidine kinase
MPARKKDIRRFPASTVSFYLQSAELYSPYASKVGAACLGLAINTAWSQHHAWKNLGRTCMASQEAKDMMLTGFIEEKWQAHRWLAHLGIAVGYALAYLVVLGALSNAPWPFAAGLRIACLLLVPYRYWPALVAGELVPLACRNFGHAHDFGLTWALLASIPPIILAMPVVWWFRARTALFPSRDLLDVRKLLYCTLTLSVLWATASFSLLSTVHLKNGPYHIPAGAAFSLFIDLYLVLLMVTPWAVIARIRPRQALRPHLSWQAIATNSVTRDIVISVILLAILTALYRVVGGAIKPFVMLVLFLPALGLTLKHGWRVCVLGGTLCLISIFLILEWRLDWRPDSNMLQIQALLAGIITFLYLFGARLSTQMQLLDALRHETFQTRQVAKKSLVLSEDRLQQTSQALECVVGILRMDYTRIMQRFIPESMRDDYSQDFWNVQREVYHIAESIYPSAWRERGLAAAMEETIGSALREAGIAYSCETPGRRMRFLSEASQVVLYRMACSAAANFGASPACIGVHLSLRMGRRHGAPWVALRMDSMQEESQVAYGLLQAKARKGVAAKLGTRVTADSELQLLARLFHGNARWRATSAGLRFTALLNDAGSRTSQRTAALAPVRLWAK